MKHTPAPRAPSRETIRKWRAIRAVFASHDWDHDELIHSHAIAHRWPETADRTGRTNPHRGNFPTP